MPAPLLIAGGLGALSLISNNQAQKNADEEAEMSARSYGIRTAGINFTAARIAENIVQQAGALGEQQIAAEVEIDKAQAAAESDAMVSAAHAGVAGSTIDAAVTETERTQAEAKGSVDRQIRAQRLQFNNDYIDNYLNAHIQKGKLEVKSTSGSDRAKNSILSFATGFLSGF